MSKGTFVKKVIVVDPDTGSDVELDVFKLEGGGMVGIDSSYLDTEEPIYSPFDNGVKIEIE
jgi:hypothetical protein